MRFSEALTTRNLSISFSNLIAFLGRIKGHSFSIFSLWALIGFNGLFLAQINTLCPTSLQNLFPAAPFCIPWLYALSTYIDNSGFSRNLNNSSFISRSILNLWVKKSFHESREGKPPLTSPTLPFFGRRLPVKILFPIYWRCKERCFFLFKLEVQEEMR